MRKIRADGKGKHGQKNMRRNNTCHCPDTGYRNKFKFATVIETQQLRAPRIETTIAVHISGSQSTTHCKDINIHAVSATEHHQENPLRVHIATDHAGLETSQYLIEQLTAAGYDMIDHGPQEYDPLDDYPSFCINAALAVKRDREQGFDSLGIVLGGSGNGEQIAANKVEGIRAALAWNHDTAALARQHNNAQVIAVGGRQHSNEEALEIIKVFLSTPWTNEERHARRIGQVAEYERTGRIEGKHIDS